MAKNEKTSQQGRLKGKCAPAQSEDAGQRQKRRGFGSHAASRSQEEVGRLVLVGPHTHTSLLTRAVSSPCPHVIGGILDFHANRVPAAVLLACRRMAQVVLLA